MKYFPFLFACLFLFASCGDDDGVSLEEDIMSIEAYLADNGLTAQSTGSGLHYIIEEEGTGDFLTPSDQVTVNYKGYLTDGDVFDETILYPATFGVGNVIPGWQEGLQLFKPGGKGTLLIPSALGYGSSPPSGSSIPKNAILIFEIEVIDDLPALEQTQIENYLADNGITTEKTASGLHYNIEDDGSGPHPNTNDQVTVFYSGYFMDGTVFDGTSSDPANISLSNVIPGWQEGIPLLKRGGRGTFFIPSDLAYGIYPPPGSGIPQNAILVFEVDLIDF